MLSVTAPNPTIASTAWASASPSQPSRTSERVPSTMYVTGLIVARNSSQPLNTSFGASAGQLGAAVIGGAGAVVVIGGIGGVLHPFVTRIPRSFLQLVVGTLLTTFGTFWALEGIGIAWPGGDGAIVGLLLLYLLTASANIALVRRRTLVLAPERR